jgi:hypothetical protein
MPKMKRRKATIEIQIKSGDKTKTHDHDIIPASFSPINNTVKSIGRFFICYLVLISVRVSALYTSDADAPA